MGWGADWVGATAGAWDEIVGKEIDSLRERATAAAKQLGAKAQTATTTGRPADALRALSGEVDLLVIGSRRWGAAARVSLGSTGESVMFHASCPVLAVPRPAN
jgi:nucleotide-binding universal stress UspA family protein